MGFSLDLEMIVHVALEFANSEARNGNCGENQNLVLLCLPSLHQCAFPSP